MLTNFLELIVDTVETHCGLSGIRMDALVDGGIYAAFDPGVIQTQYYDRSAIREWPLSFMIKSIDQRKCIDTLQSICDFLQGLKAYPKALGLVWMDATVASYPSRVARQEDGQYIYTCTINVRVYY